VKEDTKIKQPDLLVLQIFSLKSYDCNEPVQLDTKKEAGTKADHIHT